MIPLPFPIPWGLVARIALAMAIFGAGWMVNGWRWDARWNEREAEYADARTKSSEQAREREQVLADAIATIDTERTAERTKAHEEITRLRAGVDAGAVRLRVAARCPAAGVSGPAAGSVVDHGAAPELAPDARPDYFALRDGIGDRQDALAACQAILAKERQK